MYALPTVRRGFEVGEQYQYPISLGPQHSLASALMRMLRIITAALLAYALLPGPAAGVVGPWLPASDLSSATGWAQAAGTVTVKTSNDKACGSSSLELDYNVNSSMAEAGRSVTPPTLPGAALQALSLSVKGDGTYNTLWLRLEDATGEILLYRVGTLNNTSWTTMTVDLTDAPAYHTLGNNDGILDYPISLYRLVVSHNGSQPTSGTARVDCLQALNGWSLPSSSARVFVPSAGESTQLHVIASEGGDWSLTLVDELGASRVFSGIASGAGPISIDLEWQDHRRRRDARQRPWHAPLRHHRQRFAELPRTSPPRRRTSSGPRPMTTR